MDGDIVSKKEAMIRRKDFISRKAEEARHAHENAGSEVALLAREPHLPPSFDSLETIIHRYLYLENQNGWIIQPQFAHPNKILDHDDGLEGFAAERSGVMRPPHTYVGGLPFYCSAIIKQGSDKKIQVLQGDFQLTTGLDVLPMVGEFFESTKLTSALNIISLAAQTRGNDVLYVLGAETKTKKKTGFCNKLILGAQASLMAKSPLSLDGPSSIGAKIENRIKLRPRLKASFSAGLCHGYVSGGISPGAKKIQFDLKRKINNSNTISLQGSTMWLGNNRSSSIRIGYQQNITPGTFLSSMIQYSDKEHGVIDLKLRSHDHLEISFGLLAPLLGSLWTYIYREEETFSSS
jgi:hypothetical protein